MIYRRQPMEAWTAEGYFFLYWFYRGALLFVVLGAASIVVGTLVSMGSPSAGSAVAVAGLAFVALGVMALVGALALKPTDRTVFYRQSEDPAS